MDLPLKDLLIPARRVSRREIEIRLTNPVGLIRRLGLPGSGPFVLLDSAGGNPDLCRYSFLAWSPRLMVTIKAGMATLRGFDSTVEEEVGDPFGFLRKLIGALAPAAVLPPTNDGHPASGTRPPNHPKGFPAPPVTGGAFGMVSYDAGRYIEKLPSRAVDDLSFPEFDFIFPRRLICYDHWRGAAHLFFEDAAPGELEEAEGGG
ncbi:MAG: hypothetical protein ACYC6Z_11430, partial [Thermoleophilia bacterium]